MESAEKEKNWSDQETTEFYESLLQKALAEIPASGAVMVLGPMFILRPVEKNFALFESAQQKLSKSGETIFNQLPFTDFRLVNAPFNYERKFEIFYKKLIQSGKITACYLLPGWEKSLGTKSEVNYCKEFAIPIKTI